jgi:hypothetical protein
LPHRLVIAAYFYVACASGEIINDTQLYLLCHKYRAADFVPLMLFIKNIVQRFVAFNFDDNEFIETMPYLQKLSRNFTISSTIFYPDPDSVINQSLSMLKYINIKKENPKKIFHVTDESMVYSVQYGNSDLVIKEQTENEEAAIKELAIMRTLKHKNIQSANGFSFIGNDILIGMDLAKGTLHD